jgi:preprotein translocase SecE subunit
MSADRRKPRIRKSAPTVRERVEAERLKDESAGPSPLRKGAGKVASPIKRLRIPSNPLTRGLGKFFRFITPNYFINSWREVKQVTWPSRRETWRLTGAVFVFAIVFGAMVAVIDKGLDEVFKKLVLK